MLHKKSLNSIPFKPMLMLALLSLSTVGCFNPPFNDFNQSQDGFMATVMKPGKKQLIRLLKKQDIQYIEYGDTMTLLIPTDHYFVKGTATINDICYEGLNNVVALLHFYPKCRVFVASFTDNVGSFHQKMHITRARAEAMLTFLWASNIPAQDLKATGYSDLFAIGDNQLIHGSAYNRRIEIQWSKICNDQPQLSAAEMQAKANMK